ncbi:hypothetical protein ACFPYI_01810 [Halomarina salina]|uniref:Pectate lyase superfamily protein domain-containing protein n=1 Tax=Halomarina salina TaxID=1872699 RepID=A0ABD5RHX1_9EURY|nr:hypothetical protein [Halomarina salina]
METITKTIDGESYDFEIRETVHVSPGDGPIDITALMTDHTRVVFEPGEYTATVRQFGDTAAPRDCIVEVAGGGTATFTADNWHAKNPKRKWLICLDGAERVAISGLQPDNGESFAEGDIGLRLDVHDGLLLEDIEHVGFSGAEPVCEWSLWPHILDEDGVGEIRRYRKEGPSVFQGHSASDGAGGIFEAHQGHLHFQDAVIKNQGGDGGLYAGKHDGSLSFDGGELHTNDMATMRSAAGEGCEFRNVRVVIDWNSADGRNLLELPDDPVYDGPDEGNSTSEENKSPSGTNGVYLSSAEYGKTGGGFYNCEFVYESTFDPGVGFLAINASDGAVDIHDCTFKMEADGMPAIWARSPEEQRFPSHKPPEKPWGLDIRNVTIEGSGDCGGKPVVDLDARHGSIIDELEINMPNADVGVDIEGCADVEIGTTDISVGGQAIRGEYGELVTDGGSNGTSTQRLTLEASAPLRYHVRGTAVTPTDETLAGTDVQDDGTDDGAFGTLRTDEVAAFDVEAFSVIRVEPTDAATLTLAGEVIPSEEYGDMQTPAWEVDGGPAVPIPEDTDSGGDAGNGDSSDGSGDGSGDSSGDDSTGGTDTGSPTPSRPAGWGSITEFGAAPNADPSTNTSALIEAITTCSVVFVPRGTFVCDRTVIVDAGEVDVYGPGRLVASDSVGEFEHLLRFRGGRCITLDGVGLDGTAENDTARGGVRFDNVTAAAVRNCEVHGWGDYDGQTDQPHAVNFVGCQGVWATDNYVHDVGGKGINAYARNSDPIDGVVFRGNYVRHTGEEALFCGSEVNTWTRPAQFLIEGNHVRDSRSQYLVRVAGDGGENITVMRGNMAMNAATAAYNYKTPNVQHSTALIANNTYLGGGRAGISVQSTGDGHLAAHTFQNTILGDNGGILYESGCRPSLSALNVTPDLQVGEADEVVAPIWMTPGGELRGSLANGGQSGVGNLEQRLTDLEAHVENSQSLRSRLAALLGR